MLRLAFALAALVAALAGCGGDEKSAGDSKPVTVTAGKPVRVTGREYSFAPSELTVTKAGEVELTLDNKGSLAHNLKVERGGKLLGGTPTFQGGAPRSGSVRLEAGEYTMVCTVGNHAELGMKGTLTVR